MRKRVVGVLLALSCLLAGAACAQGPVERERVRFETAGVSLALPLSWLYMDMSDQLDGPIDIDGEAVVVSAYVAMIDMDETIQATLVAMPNDGAVDPVQELEAIAAAYGEDADMRKISGREFCVYPTEDGGLAAVGYTDDNFITLYGIRLGETEAYRISEQSFVAQFLQLADTMQFFRTERP